MSEDDGTADRTAKEFPVEKLMSERIKDARGTIPFVEVIPGVSLSSAEYDTPEKRQEFLRLLKPRDKYPGLWEKYPEAFGEKK